MVRDVMGLLQTNDGLEFAGGLSSNAQVNFLAKMVSSAS